MKCSHCNSNIADWAVFCPYCNTQQPGRVEPADYEYAAFISYRHAPRDQETAIAVQKAIEGYRLPRNVATMHNDLQGGRKLGRVFRDEDELTAAYSLPDHIMNALARSRSLVVICSPDTPASIWVPNEVLTFAQLHGREHIHVVLAAGDELANIPALLKTKIVVDASGTPRAIPTEPLAADLRPESAHRASMEKLRVIASVAGCGFDELRQRERARKRRTAAYIVAGAALIASIIGVFAYQANVEHRNAQQAESYQLAIQSQRLLDKGDRYGAIEAALAALPDASGGSGAGGDGDDGNRSGGNNANRGNGNRPFVPEAQEALENALQVHPDRYASWRSSYRLEAAAPIGDSIRRASMVSSDGQSAGMSDIVVCQETGLFAASDRNGNVATYDIATGRLVATCAVPGTVGTGEASESTQGEGSAGVVGVAGADEKSATGAESTGENEAAQPAEALDATTETAQAAIGQTYLYPAGEHLVVNAFSNGGFVGCYDVNTGEQVWAREDFFAYDVTVSPDGQYVATTTFLDTGEMQTDVVRVQDGQVVQSGSTTQVQAPSLLLSGGAFGGEGDFYVAFGNTLVHERFDGEIAVGTDNPGDASDEDAVETAFTFAEGDAKAEADSEPPVTEAEDGAMQVETVQLAYPIACSMSYANGVLVVASMADEMEEPYAIEAFDANLNKLWSYEGTYRSRVVYHDDGYTLVRGMPAVWNFIAEDDSVVVTSAGRDVMMFDAKTGESVFEDRQIDVIVNLQTRDDDQLQNMWLFMATCDGAISLQAPFVDSDDAIDEYTRTSLPEPIRWAGEYYDGTTMTAIALSAEDGNCILASHSNIVGDTNREAEDRDYTLAELQDLAHQTLQAAGRE